MKEKLWSITITPSHFDTRGEAVTLLRELEEPKYQFSYCTRSPRVINPRPEGVAVAVKKPATSNDVW